MEKEKVSLSIFTGRRAVSRPGNHYIDSIRGTLDRATRGLEKTGGPWYQILRGEPKVVHSLKHGSRLRRSLAILLGPSEPEA